MYGLPQRTVGAVASRSRFFQRGPKQLAGTGSPNRVLLRDGPASALVPPT